ncbi:uncharacterized protein LOC143460304 [Clavelina lepadiformis]|uniref:uncharacterized protein LOC143460304 n=1 Tax=Clavelina lepadiformis TaxID=159417 RepID=UPI004041790E
MISRAYPDRNCPFVVGNRKFINNPVHNGHYRGNHRSPMMRNDERRRDERPGQGKRGRDFPSSLNQSSRNERSDFDHKRNFAHYGDPSFPNRHGNYQSQQGGMPRVPARQPPTWKNDPRQTIGVMRRQSCADPRKKSPISSPPPSQERSQHGGKPPHLHVSTSEATQVNGLLPASTNMREDKEDFDENLPEFDDLGSDCESDLAANSSWLDVDLDRFERDYIDVEEPSASNSPKLNAKRTIARSSVGGRRNHSASFSPQESSNDTPVSTSAPRTSVAGSDANFSYFSQILDCEVVTKSPGSGRVKDSSSHEQSEEASGQNRNDLMQEVKSERLSPDVAAIKQHKSYKTSKSHKKLSSWRKKKSKCQKRCFIGVKEESELETRSSSDTQPAPPGTSPAKSNTTSQSSVNSKLCSPARREKYGGQSTPGGAGSEHMKETIETPKSPVKSPTNEKRSRQDEEGACLIQDLSTKNKEASEPTRRDPDKLKRLPVEGRHGNTNTLSPIIKSREAEQRRVDPDKPSDDVMIKELISEQRRCLSQGRLEKCDVDVPMAMTRAANQNEFHRSQSLQCENQQVAGNVESSVVGKLPRDDISDGELVSNDEEPSNNFQASKLNELEALDKEYELLDLYAPDEDCVSLYSNARITRRKKSTQSAGERRVIPASSDAEILAGSNDNEISVRRSVDLINMLLDYHCSSQTAMAVETFLQLFLHHKPAVFDAKVFATAQRLSLQLLEFNKMSYLQKLVRLTLSMKIFLDEGVLDKLFQHLHQQKDSQTLQQLVDKVRKCDLGDGNPVYGLVRKWSSNIRHHRNNAGQINKRLSSPPPGKDAPRKEFPTSIMSQKQPASSRRVSFHQHLTDSRPVEGSSARFGSNQRGEKHKANRSDRHERYGDRNLKPPSDENHCPIRAGNRFEMNSRHDNQPSKSALLKTPSHSQASGLTKAPSADDIAEQNLAAQIKNAACCRDWSALGRRFGELIGVIGSQMIEDKLLTAFVDLLTLKSNENAAIFGQFCDAAKFLVKHTCPEEFDVLMICSTRIALTIIKNGSKDLAYGLVMYLWEDHLDYLTLTSLNDKSSSPLTPCDNVMTFILACMHKNDCKTAARLAQRFFVEKHCDVSGPRQGQALSHLLELVTRHCVLQNHLDLGVCCIQAMPRNYASGSEVPLLQEILRTILRQEFVGDNTAESLKTLAEQMLSRLLLSSLRLIINESPLNKSVLSLFEYLESKGIYKFPLTARSPHLVVIPYTMGQVEMSMALFRHLTELSLLLFELGEKLLDKPLRVILSWNIGCLTQLCTAHSKDLYQEASSRLLETFDTLMKPPLALQYQDDVTKTREMRFNLSSSSVRKWLLLNTNYREESSAGVRMRKRVSQVSIDSLRSSVTEVLNSHVREERGHSGAQKSRQINSRKARSRNMG